MRIDNELAAAYVHCPHKALLRLIGNVGEKTAYDSMDDQLESDYQKSGLEQLRRLYPSSSIVENDSFGSDGLVGRNQLRLLVRYSGPSHAWTFPAIEVTKNSRAERELVPIRFSRSVHPTQQLKILAAIDAVVLSQVQNVPVQAARVIYGPNYDTAKVNLIAQTRPTNLAARARQVLTELEALIINRSAKLMLNRHCDVCEFRSRCHQEALDKDDLSLLRGLSRKEIDTFNERGVFTVTQLAHTFRAKSMRHTQQKRHSIPLQAKAIKDSTVYIRKAPPLSLEANCIYFDVEGTPDTDRYYLIGMLIETGDGRTMRTFWADSPDDEEPMWRAFLAEILCLGNWPLLHFGRYEKDFVNCMFQRYGGSDGVARQQVNDRLLDIHATVRTNVFFPVHSNGLKQIAAYLGASWFGPVTTGLDSIVWRHEWEQTKEGQLKQELVRYNAEDCSALKIVSDFLRSLSGPNNESIVPTKLTETLTDTAGFGSKTFAIPEIKHFTKCAYFNYQHDKIFFRTDKNVRKSIRRKKRITRATDSCAGNGGCTGV